MFEKPQILIDLADAFASELSHAAAAERCGVSKPTYWRFMAESRAGVDGYLIDYMGEVAMPFHEAIRRARIIGGVYETEARFMKRARDGHDSPTYFRGEPVWIMAHDLPLNDPGYVPLDCPDNMLEILYGVRDRVARHPITEAKLHRTEHHEPPVAAVVAVLQANLPRIYGNHQTIDVNQHNSGRMLIEHKRSAPPPPLAAVPAMTLPPLAIAAPTAEVEQVAEVEPEPDVEQVVEVEAEPQAPVVSVDSDGNPIYANPEPQAAPMVTRVDLSTLTPAQRAAREHYETLAARPPTHPRPTAAVQIFQPSDEPAAPPALVVRAAPPTTSTYQNERDHIGAGIPLAGGMKVR